MKKQKTYSHPPQNSNGICQNTAGVHPACATSQHLQNKTKGRKGCNAPSPTMPTRFE